MSIKLLSFMVLSTLIYSCKPDEKPIKTGKEVQIAIEHVVDGIPIEKGKVNYTNASGNEYSITRLEYYLSNFRFITENGEIIVHDQVYYISAFDTNTHTLIINDLPPTDYTKIIYNFGLTPGRNLSNSLPNTNENANMFWPEMMGGGYHFMKLEGRYRDTTALSGYAIHLGTNVCTMEVSKDVSISNKTDVGRLTLTKNINEWYTNPKDYDFINHGRYTMGDTVLMEHIIENGQTVFTLK